VDDYRTVNRLLWDERGPVHAVSADYGVERFVADPAHLSDVVRFDLPLLGDVSGLNGIHLQCHIGTDTLSLHRLGAHMSGLDFSGASLAQARQLAGRAGADIDYRESDVYQAAEVFQQQSFDLVFTGIGALCWLPDICAWARVVVELLKPGGRLFLRDSHPMWAATGDPRPDGLITLEYSYFGAAAPLVWDEPGTYVATEHEFVHTRELIWHHGLGEIVQALIDAGIAITGLVEHQSIPWEARPGEMTRGSDGEHRLVSRPERLPLSYTLQGIKQASIDNPRSSS
jgi:SAM-dependent methyltransferase